MTKSHPSFLLAFAVLCSFGFGQRAWAVPEPAAVPLQAQLGEVKKVADKGAVDAGDALKRGDTAWMLVSSALVMLMVPGLALSSTAAWSAERTYWPR